MQKHLKHLREVTMRRPLTISVSLQAMETASHNIIWAFFIVMAWVLKKSQSRSSWLYLAAQQRHMLSNFAIAKLMETHPHLADRKKGRLHFLKEAAFLGHAIAPLEIGNFYYSRQETDFDLVRAMVWWIVSSDRDAPGAVEMISSVSPLLNRVQMDQVTVKLADCDNKSYRDCLGNF